jgi:LmbE family N-acetylglucosaminyl deacetylase
MTVNLSTPKRALAIGAHPDDIEFGCGGTLAKWARRGCEIFHLICTDGSKGTWNPSQDPRELVAMRQNEQRAAARALGGRGDVVFLGLPDGELHHGITERKEIARWIRHFQPDVLLGHDPWRRYRLHPDHRHAGFLVTDGIVAARDPLFFTDIGLAPHRPATLLLWEADEPDHVEDVTDTFDAKLEALLAHKSQLESTMHIPPSSLESFEDSSPIKEFARRLREQMSKTGAPHDFAAAEAFKLIENL